MVVVDPDRSLSQGCAPHAHRTGCHQRSVGRIGIVGAGAMGSTLAALLGDVMYIAIVCRNPQRAAEIIRHGVRTSGLFETSARPVVVRSIADLQNVGGVSVLFVATKTTSIPAVAEELKPVLRRISQDRNGAFIVSFQNGIECARELMGLLDYPRVLRMVLYIGATSPDLDGAVKITLDQPPHYIGTLDPAYRRICYRIASVLSSAGFHTCVASDIEKQVWRKGILNAATNPVCALVNANIDQVLRSPARAIVAALVAEGIAVATAHGVALGDEYVSHSYNFLEHARGHTPSMVEDIRERRKSEIGQLNRQLIEHGRRLRIPTPTHEFVDALIETLDAKVDALGTPS